MKTTFNKGKIIRIRHRIRYYTHGKNPVVSSIELQDTYLQTFYYNDNNELIVEHDADYTKAALFEHDNDVMEYNEVNYDIDDIVKLLENHFKPKKDYYINAVTYKIIIG